MPQTQVLFYQERNACPVVDWLIQLRRRQKAVYAKCVARIERLSELGHELRRLEADFLRDGLHELRIRKGRVNYRILYFFHGKNVVVLTHALTKEDVISESDFRRAVERKHRFEKDPAAHTYTEETPDAKD